MAGQADEGRYREVIKTWRRAVLLNRLREQGLWRRAERPIDHAHGQFAQLVVAQNVRSREPGQDPATRTFQAIRFH